MSGSITCDNRPRTWPTLVLSLIAVVATSGRELYAELTIGLRFPNGQTTMQVRPADVGNVASLFVWASATNIDRVNGVGTHEGLRLAHYSIVSSRLISGIDGSIGGDIIESQLREPFDAAGSSEGLIQDLNGDGVDDLGVEASSSNLGYARPRSQITTWDDSADGTHRAIPNGHEFLVQVIRFRIDEVPPNPAPGNGTRFSIVVPPWSDDGIIKGALWYQDSDESAQDGRNEGTFASGTSVTFLAVPEPGGAALLAAAAAAIVLLRCGAWQRRAGKS